VSTTNKICEPKKALRTFGKRHWYGENRLSNKKDMALEKMDALKADFGY